MIPFFPFFCSEWRKSPSPCTNPLWVSPHPWSGRRCSPQRASLRIDGKALVVFNVKQWDVPAAERSLCSPPAHPAPSNSD